MFEFFTTVSECDAKNFSPVTLAFVGDAVYTLYVRERLVLKSCYSTGKLQELTSSEISARGQNGVLERILPELTEEERSIFKRGRNAKKPTRSKHATIIEYNNSTGFEALIGYLYLTGQYKRIDTLLAESNEN